MFCEKVTDGKMRCFLTRSEGRIGLGVFWNEDRVFGGGEGRRTQGFAYLLDTRKFERFVKKVIGSGRQRTLPIQFLPEFSVSVLLSQWFLLTDEKDHFAQQAL